ncbi:hypothetical protein ARALYDRAFT_917890 [Arabidopsis lyrata subsp. lyrata]|uniref:Uncharacterized protein n=1 Tax=Arabidopsis lyrata subsp. lyrata TaxID=81972 RepID=D7MNN9_ARALL|nr:hypothetical protein ARALYDRAFT_917890 [Arabidopsis lyrata subsp. lyrata]
MRLRLDSNRRHLLRRRTLHRMMMNRRFHAYLGGVGSLDSTCKLVADLNLTRDLNITGKGNLHVLPGVRLVCQFSGCSISVNISENFSLAENSGKNRVKR